jgi:uncharacterized membrane protein
MLIQKTLHMSQSLEECKSRLASIHSYRRHLAMVTHANVTSSKTLDFGFRGPLGFEGHTVISTLESDQPEQVAFESWGGNIKLMGLVEFEEVRTDCTEVSIAVYYEIKNRFYAWLDRRFGFVEAFLNAELRSLRAHFEGIAAPVPERMPVFAVFEPVSA